MQEIAGNRCGGLDSEAGTTYRSTALENKTACMASHAFEEAVSAGSFLFVWLISAFDHNFRF